VATVRWATASEINCDRFDVERSADGRVFRRIGSLACAGPASDYAFRDEAAAGTCYYRLRQADTDGQTHYSPVAYVGAGADTALGLSVFPNPTTGIVTLLGVPTTAVLALSLTNALGQPVLAAAATPLPAAVAALNAALSQCAPGVYVLTAELGGQRQHLKLIKQ
jgi:hypothetical protein